MGVLSAVSPKNADERRQHRHVAEPDFEKIELKMFQNFTCVDKLTLPVANHPKDRVKQVSRCWM